MTKRRVIIILTLTLAAWILTGCDPQAGQLCDKAGTEVYDYPDHWSCQKDSDGNSRWVKDYAYDLGVGTWKYAGKGRS